MGLADEHQGELVAATEDELRAELWQRNQAMMHAGRAAAEARLHGSESARHQLHVDWQPLEQWLIERGQGMPVEDDC